ncbi:hypothetical protein HMI54_012357 [Coelomomyces lativittatus]|nr:hypothetical protein HMI56_006798 [Coelomomyces lativittatus]KAJ1513931.1 hypothetical protein HMI55_005107 [Coelomomyces lativittatus]KAJ1515433.1 hypothetical protein HMI54_012357 [Coelomomyces lativittatus]
MFSALFRYRSFQLRSVSISRLSSFLGGSLVLSPKNFYTIEAANPTNEEKTKKKNIATFLQLGLFTAAIYAASTYFFNIQKQRSIVMRNILFRMRVNEMLQKELGQNIDLAGLKFIRGTINEVKGLADVTFDIVGSKEIKAHVQLKMQRYPNDQHRWQTTELYITLPDNRIFSGYVDESTEQLVLE